MDKIEPAGAPGRRANQRSVEAKNEVAAILQACGCTFEKNVPIEPLSIYGRQQRVDFIVHGSELWPAELILEVQTQWKSGSADQKLVYLERNIKETYPLATAVVVLGDGWGSGAVEWLEHQVDQRKLVRVLRLDDLVDGLTRQKAG